jgi:hypothetical protein
MVEELRQILGQFPQILEIFEFLGVAFIFYFGIQAMITLFGRH